MDKLLPASRLGYYDRVGWRQVPRDLSRKWLASVSNRPRIREAPRVVEDSVLHPVGPSPPGDAQVKMFTARAITSPRIAIEISDWTVIVSLAQGASGIASVGLNAVAFVKAR